MTPFVKWAGGKRQLINEIKKEIPEYNGKYLEPFLGGGAVFFSHAPTAAVLGDFNEELINVYTMIKRAPERLIEAVNEHKKNHCEEYYYLVRNWDREDNFAEIRSPIERAGRFIYLNKTGFNGLYRVNRKGLFNVPYGKQENPSMIDEENIREISKYLNSHDIRFLFGDFSNVLKEAVKDDFVYLDPPYAPLSASSSFNSYTDSGFNYDEQRRLKEAVDALTEAGVKVLASNSYCDFILDLYKDYEIKAVDARRSINSNAEKRGKIKEVLIRNY